MNSGIPCTLKQRFSPFLSGHTKCGSAPPLGTLGGGVTMVKINNSKYLTS